MATDAHLRRLAINDRIRAIRRRRGLTQTDVAEAAHLHRVTYQRIEGGGPLNLDQILAIAAALGVSPTEFFTPTPSPPDSPEEHIYQLLVTAAATRVAALSIELNDRLA